MRRSMMIRSLLIVLSMLVCVSGICYVINMRRQAALSQTLEQLKRQNTASMLTVIRLRHQIQELKDKPVVAQMVPMGPDEPGILNGLQKLASKTGVKLQSITFSMPGMPGSGLQSNGALANTSNLSSATTQPPSTIQQGNAVTVLVTLTGSDDQLINFVKDLDMVGRKVVLMNVNYTIGTNMLVNGLVLQMSYPYQQG